MSQDKKHKTKKIGQVWLKKKENKADPDKFFIRFGESDNKDPKYNFSVELTIKDPSGKVLHHQKDGFLNLYDPRASKFSTGKEPQNLQFEVVANLDE